MSVIPVPDAETVAALIKELVAVMSGQSPYALDDSIGLEHIPVPAVAFAVQQCFGVAIPPAAIGPETRTLGQLTLALGTAVHNGLEARGPMVRPSASRRVLIVGASALNDLGHALARRGLRAAVLAHHDPASGVTASRVTDLEVVDYVEAIDWTRPLEIVQRIVDLHASGYIDGVIANDEFGLLPAAIATSRLGIPGPSLRGVHNTRDKFHMRRALEQAGLNQVRYAVCRGLADAQAFLSTIHGPIIVKPVTGTGSEGVSRVETAEELAAAYKTATSAVGSMGILCEEFIDGPEVSLEGYCVDGRFVAVALTDKLTDEHFLETGHQQPTAHPQSVIDAAAAIAAQSLPLLGIDNAVTHTEFRVSATRGPVLIETHTRMGGDQIHVLTRLTTGVDLADLMVAFSIGETVDAHPAGQGRGAAIRFSTGRPGRVRAVQLPPRTAHSGIEAVFTPSIGRQFSGLSASRERQAYVIASAPTPELAGASAESFLSQVQVSYFE